MITLFSRSSLRKNRDKCPWSYGLWFSGTLFPRRFRHKPVAKGYRPRGNSPLGGDRAIVVDFSDGRNMFVYYDRTTRVRSGDHIDSFSFRSAGRRHFSPAERVVENGPSSANGGVPIQYRSSDWFVSLTGTDSRAVRNYSERNTELEKKSTDGRRFVRHSVRYFGLPPRSSTNR